MCQRSAARHQHHHHRHHQDQWYHPRRQQLRIMLSRLIPGKHTHHIERVKFGAPLEQVCANDVIPAAILVLILKLNKEAPYKKDVFRAPGHQANMKKLIYFLQTGRLMNIDKFSVYTIASVLKKFLRKLPGGIFGPDVEKLLFDVIQQDSIDDKRREMQRLITSLPLVNQQLLVLLFGTFRAIASAAGRAATGMTSEALAVSVAPSFFQSCMGDKITKVEDVQRFKAHITTAISIVRFLIDNFGVSNLFGRENYEFYARISGRVLKVENDWVFAIKFPPDHSALPTSAGDSPTCHDSLLIPQQSAPLLCASTSTATDGAGRGCIYIKSGWALPPGLLDGSTMLADDAYARLSMSLEENVFKATWFNQSKDSPTSVTGGVLVTSMQQPKEPHQQSSPPIVQTHHPHSHTHHHHFQSSSEKTSPENDLLTRSLSNSVVVRFGTDSTKSLTFCPQVHERQLQRLKTRSEWFLSPDPDSP